MPPRSAPKLFPIEPLLETAHVSLSELARLTKASGHAIHVAEVEGLTDRQADRWAVRCRLHPIDVWGDLWLEVA